MYTPFPGNLDSSVEHHPNRKPVGSDGKNMDVSRIHGYLWFIYGLMMVNVRDLRCHPLFQRNPGGE